MAAARMCVCVGELLLFAPNSMQLPKVFCMKVPMERVFASVELGCVRLVKRAAVLRGHVGVCW